MMKRRVFGMLLSLCLVLALIPAAAFAELTLTVPYTINVVKGGSEEPGKTDFYVKLIENTGDDWRSKGDVSIECPVVTTNGVDVYDGKLTLTGTVESLRALNDGIYVKQVDEGKEGWKYDERVWCVKINLEESGDGLIFTEKFYLTEYDSEIGMYIPLDNSENGMNFTDRYTMPKPEETPKPEVTPDPDDASSDANVSALPKTGDSSNLTGWLILLAVSAAAVAGAVVYGRRRKNARE